MGFRAGRRYVPRLVRDAIEPAPAPTFRADGAYVITGGLGGLGRKTAEWLILHGARQLILVGRTAAPDSPTVAALERLGAVVKVIAADIAADDAVAILRAATAATPVCGIIHAAAVFDNTPLIDVTQESLEAALRPKLAGALNLVEYGVEAAPISSSYSRPRQECSVPGGWGPTRRPTRRWTASLNVPRRRGIPAVSINWGTWDEMGGTSEEDRQSFARKGLEPMPSELRARRPRHRRSCGPNPGGRGQYRVGNVEGGIRSLAASADVGTHQVDRTPLRIELAP